MSNKIDLKIDAYDVSISPQSYNKLSVSLENVEKSELDTEEIAKCISFETYLNVHDADDILSYLGTDYIKNYLENLV